MGIGLRRVRESRNRASSVQATQQPTICFDEDYEHIQRTNVRDSVYCWLFGAADIAPYGVGYDGLVSQKFGLLCQFCP